MISQSFLISISLMLLLIEIVLSGPNLCQNPKIDSIAYINDQKQYFFTSGGYYWLIKETEMPPPADKAKPLPNGFKVGEAAFYKNTLKACAAANTAGRKHQEQEVYVVEKKGSMNQIMIFDLRDFSWGKPFDYNRDRALSQAEVDWTQTIDAIFVHKVTQIYVVQGNKYAAIDYRKLCENPEDFADGFKRQSRDDFNTQDHILAMTMISDDTILMFMEKGLYFEVTIKVTKDGRLSTTKSSDKSIAKEFFKFGDDCSAPLSPPLASEPTGSPGPDVTPVLPVQTQPSKKGEGGNESINESKDEQKGGKLWIIVVIVVVVVVIIVIALIAVMAIHKEKASADSGPEAGKESDGTAAVGTNVAAGSGPTKSSINSKAGGGSKLGSKVGPSKAGSSSALGGTSPSRMSVRSKMSAIPSGVATKSSTAPKSAVKSSVSKN